MTKTRLKALRLQQEMTQAEAAAIIGVTASQYGKIERGVSLTDQGNLIKLAGHYDVSLDYLLGLSEDRNPPSNKPASQEKQPPFDPVREGVLMEFAKLDNQGRRLLWAIAVQIRQSQEQRALGK